jgi:hypothetical protein
MTHDDKNGRTLLLERFDNAVRASDVSDARACLQVFDALIRAEFSAPSHELPNAAPQGVQPAISRTALTGPAEAALALAEQWKDRADDAGRLSRAVIESAPSTIEALTGETPRTQTFFASMVGVNSGVFRQKTIEKMEELERELAEAHEKWQHDVGLALRQKPVSAIERNTPSDRKMADLLVEATWKRCVGQCIGDNCGRLFISRERFDEHIAPLIRRADGGGQANG